MRTIEIANQRVASPKRIWPAILRQNLLPLGTVFWSSILILRPRLQCGTEAHGTAEVLLGEAVADAVAVDVPACGVRLLPAVPDRLRVAERTLGSQVGSERVLAKALRKLSADIVLIGCPPSMGILTASALVASSAGIISPLAVAPEALDGFVQVSANLQRLRDALDLRIPVVAVVPTRYDQRLRIARNVLDAAKNLCNGMLTAPIRENVVLRELFGHRQPVRTYRPDSTGAADYAALAAEVLTRV